MARGARDTEKQDTELDLLERSPSFELLDECLADAAGGQGRFVLIAGEAGVGKSALVQRFCAQHRARARILWGACDALHTPRPLGPFLDIAATTGGLLEEVTERGGKPQSVYAALLAELRSSKPTITVLEDVHWADEATLDMLKLLGRRAESADALVIATYRDDELDSAHPLRVAVGELGAAEGIRRVQLAPLSLEAVTKLAATHAVDADDLYRKTDGNPFFVTEVLAAGETEIPPTVSDAVLARAGRLSQSARRVLEAVAVVPPRVELWLLEALVGGEMIRLERCLASGILCREADEIAFRHDLARLAIEDSITPHRRVVLHREALQALRTPARGNPDLARLAHHAEAAGDAEAVLEFAPAAAARAASLGAHREAAAQYARTLRFADRLPPETRAALLERRFHECFLTDQYDEAIEALERALEYYRRLGDRRREGDALRSLSEILWCPGRTAEAEGAARQAVALLETLPPGRELAMAYSRLSQLSTIAENADEAAKWSARALELGQRLDDVEIVARTLNDLGTMAWLAGSPDGRETIERSLELAEQAGLEAEVGSAYRHLAWVSSRNRSHAVAAGYVQNGLDYCAEHGLDLFRLYLLTYRARSELDQGRWSEAVDSAALVLRVPRSSTTPRILALVTVGLVRARRGDRGPRVPLDEALALAEPTGELHRIAPVAAAKAEALWLEGKRQAVEEATEAAFDLAMLRRASWPIGELAYWRWRAGVREPSPPGAAEPYALQIAGDWQAAASLWERIGCPYEAALALAEGDDDAQRRSLGEFHRLGARPAARIVSRGLRKRGARGLPRGPRPATRGNPAHLTARELEVVGLLAEGLTNAEIADRLFLSQKTVGHHVSSILRKLDVRTRGQAGAEAVRLGIAPQDR